MKKLSLPLSLGWFFSLCANPEAPIVIAGDAQFHQNGSLMQIQCADRTIIDWQSFSVRPEEIARFIQPNAGATVLNRVKGFNPSEILGSLQSNGILYLINPNGVLVGDGAIINTASFFCSTLDVSNDQFLEGNELLFEGDSKASILNLGSIQANLGDIALIAYKIENPGKIEALQGTASLATSQKVLLKFKSDPLLNICTEIDGDQIDHSGAISALKTEIQTSGPYALAMNLSGTIEATSLVKENGKIFLKADGRIEIAKTARLDASQGTIEIQNPEGLLIHNGTMDVSGDKGAGSISITTSRFINGGSLLADSQKGSGGDIRIATDAAYIETISGRLSAKSAEKDGGSIAVSAGESRFFSSGTYSVDSSEGQGGTIQVTGKEIILMATDLSASSALGGGEIFIGGGFHGENPKIANASWVHINSAVKIKADSLDGNGGQIAIWSNEKTENYGTISSKSLRFGDGGTIEISSKGELICAGEANASAVSGRPGTLLLDPYYIVIDATTGIYPQYQLFDPSAMGTNFGSTVTALTNGNIAVGKQNDSVGGVNAGAVYLYNGLTAGPALISTVIGAAGDLISSGGIVALNNGNAVISSPDWNKPAPGAAATAGAATFLNGTTGLTGTVSISNSLYGSTASDQIGRNALGERGIFGLTNGNYVVCSPLWDFGVVVDVGAGTAVSGTTGIPLQGVSAGEAVSSTNSIRGSTLNDRVGSSTQAAVPGATALSNGNYVFVASLWNNTAPGFGTVNSGAVIWGNGATGLPVGAVSINNATYPYDPGSLCGEAGVFALIGSNHAVDGNFVVCTPHQANTAGANTGTICVCSGTTGIPILSVFPEPRRIRGDSGGINSIVCVGAGFTPSMAGSGGVLPLPNGDFVAFTPHFRTNLVNMDLGAVTYCGGYTGRTVNGALSIVAGNSITGSTTNRAVGGGGGLVLSNGNYVIISPDWDIDNLTLSTGAVTLVNGSGASKGIPVAGGAVGQVVTITNSFYGATAGERVGSGGVTALTNGNFVVLSPESGDGRATLINGSTGIPIAGGAIGQTATNANSLHGSLATDDVGTSAAAFTNGNYAVISPGWDGVVGDGGAITVVNGTTGIPVVAGVSVGDAVSTLNSVTGSTLNDQVGSGGVVSFPGNNFIAVKSPLWDGVGLDSGAITIINGTTGLAGSITKVNSILGSAAGSGLNQISYDSTNNSFGAGFPTDGTGLVPVGIFEPNQMTFLRAQAQTMTIHPNFITDVLGAGTAVQIQSNSDTTINSPMTVAGGSASFTIRAGRSIIVNDNVSTNNGNLTLIANDLLASGVVDAFRDAGSAVVTLAAGKTINVGTGNLSIQLLNGTGLTNSASGDVSIGIGSALTATGGGAISVFAQVNNISMAAGSSAQTVNGNIGLQAGVNVATGASTTLQSSGNGALSVLAGSGSIIMGNLTVGQTVNGNITFQAGTNIIAGATNTIEATGIGAISLTASTGTIGLGSASFARTLSGSITALAATSAALGTNAFFRSTGAGAISVTAQANDITMAVGSFVQTASGNISMLAGSNIAIGTALGAATVQAAGNGTVSIYAQSQNITLGNSSLVQSLNGDILMQAGISLLESSPFTIQSLGLGGITIVADDLFATPPGMGAGIINFATGTISSASFVNFYLVTPYVNFFPATINGSPYNIGDASVETFGSWYPVISASGLPFHIYYKVGFAPPPPPTIPVASAVEVVLQFQQSITEPPFFWRHPVYGGYLDYDHYAPDLTYKGLNLIIPPLVSLPETEKK